ncbi:MAG: glycosyltransferase family 39 protein [candidate division WOR-3 bacterium]
MKRALLVFGIALGARLVPYGFAVAHPERVFLDNFDTKQYYALASNMIAHSSFSTYPALSFLRPARGPWEPDGFRVPVYPLALVPARALLGDRPILVLLWQVLLVSLVPVILYFLGLKIWGQRAGFAAGLIMALDPASVTLCGYFFADAFFGLMISMSLLGFWYYLNQRKTVFGAIFGLLGGLTTLTKPMVALMFPVLFLMKPKMWKKMAVAFATYGVLVGGWIIRNQLTFGVPTISGVSSYNLYFHNYAAMVAHKKGIHYLAESDSSVERFMSQHPNPDNPIATVDSLGKWAAREISKDPFTYLIAHFKEMHRLFIPEITYGAIYYGKVESPRVFSRIQTGEMNLPELSGKLMSLIPQYWKAMIYQGIFGLYMLILIILSFSATRRNWRKSKWFTLGLVLFSIYTIIIPGPTITIRFMTGLTPLLAALAGGAFVKDGENFGKG